MATTKQPFTVVLLRPDYMAGDGKDVYVSLTEGATSFEALTNSRNEAFRADKRDNQCPISPTDYHLVAVFSGHQTPVLWAFQIPQEHRT